MLVVFSTGSCSDSPAFLPLETNGCLHPAASVADCRRQSTRKFPCVLSHSLAGNNAQRPLPIVILFKQRQRE